MSLILALVGTIASAAMAVTKALAVVGLALDGLKTVGNMLMSLGKSLGLIRPETKTNELGDKALQAEQDGMNPEDFSSYAEYVEAIDNYELDPEKSKMIPEEEKIKKGMELVSGVMIEKYNDLPMQELCIAFGENPEFFTEAKMQEIGKMIMEDSQSIPDILNYIDGTEKNEDKLDNMIQTLTVLETTENPELSEMEALEAVLDLRK